MQLGLAGVLEKMESMGSLSNASKYWSAGDRVGYLFAIDGLEEDGVTPHIPVGYLGGHSVDLGDDYNRSFLTSTSEIDPKTNKPVKKDFIYNVAGIMSALLKGEYELAIAEKKKLHADNPTRLQIEIENVDKSYEDKYPTVGGYNIRAYTEVGVFKLDANNQVIGQPITFQRASLVLTKKRAKMLIAKIREQGVYIPGTNYVYIYMNTLSGDKKEAGKVDYNVINDHEKKLENVVNGENGQLRNPGFQEAATRFIENLSLSHDSILAKVYDAQPWDESEFKSAVAQYVSKREYMLQDDDGNYFDFVRREENVETLRSLGLVATADQIEVLLDKKEEDGVPFTGGIPNGEQPQQLNIGGIDGTQPPNVENVDPFSTSKAN